MNREKVNFNELFDEWAATYDYTVYDREGEYKEVFEKYDLILDRVASAFQLPEGSLIVELGVGTGNLSRRLLERGYKVIGVEPSEEMRRIAKAKLPQLTICDGSFLRLPDELDGVDGFASTYAFHHLTDDEKESAIADLCRRLKAGGKIVFADTAFENLEAKRQIRSEAEKNGQLNLLKDLDTEFYPEIRVLERIFREAGLSFACERMNKFVWLFMGEK